MVATSELPLVHTNLGLQHKYYQEVKAYVLTHHLEHMFEVIIQEMALHRPVNWRGFLVQALEHYRSRTGQRLLQDPMHLRHKEEPEPYCKARSLRQLCRTVLFLIMEQRPADPITMAVECFSMPDDLTELENRGIFAARLKRYTANHPAYTAAYERGLLLEPEEWGAVHMQVDWWWRQFASTTEGATLDEAAMLKVVALVGGEHSGTTLAQLDLNGDGAIDRGEFDLFMHSVLPTEESALDAACDAMRRRLLQWQDSVIAALVSSGRVDRADSPLVDQLWTLFRRWDAKKDNVLCMEELAAALAECHVPVDLATQKFGWTEATALSPLQFAEVFISLWPEGTVAVQTTRLLQLLEQLAEGSVNERQVAAMLHPTPFMAQLLTLFDLWDVNASGKLEEDEIATMKYDVRVELGDYYGPAITVVNRAKLVTLLSEAWGEGEEGQRKAALAEKALRKRASGSALSDAEIVRRYVAPDHLYANLNALFDLWDMDHSESLQGKEMIVLLRDIGFDTQAIVRIKEDQSLDREEFLQFLVEEWGNDAAEKAAMALEALAQRRSGDAARAALEEEGKLESTVAAMIAPSVVNEKLKQLFKEWDVDHTRYIDLKELAHFMKQMGGPFAEQVTAEGSFSEEVMARGDVDGSGKLDTDEFVALMKALWQEHAMEQAEAMLVKLRFITNVLNGRLQRLKKAWGGEGAQIDRHDLDVLFAAGPPAGWDDVPLPPVPREGRAHLMLPVDEVLEAIKTHLGTKEQAEAFLLVDALDFQVTFGRSMLEEEETTRGYYKIFDLLDTDLSGRLDIKELQAMLNAIGGGGYAEGVMQLTDEDGSGELDKVECAAMLKGFFDVKDPAEAEAMLAAIRSYAEQVAAGADPAAAKQPEQATASGSVVAAE